MSSAIRSGGRSRARPRWGIDDVLARTDLASLLDELAQPATNLIHIRRWHCPVPGHDDRHASVSMHTDANGHERWRCWSGDDTHRGDALDLVQVTQRLDHSDALDWLARRAGMTPSQALPPPKPRMPAPSPTVVPLDPSVVRYARACEKILWTPQGRPVREWLASRGFRPGVVRANHVGADPGWQWMRRPPGLPHGNRIGATFPALDEAGEIRYVQTRYLSGRGPKYDNPAARLGSNPRLSWAVPAGPPGLYPALAKRLLVVCEGIPDALTAAQAGFQAAAVLGAQYPDTSVAARLAARADRDNLDIVAIIDNDPTGAGQRWGQRLEKLLAEHDQTLTIIEPTIGQDLNDWAQRDASWSGQIIAAPLANREPSEPPGHMIEPAPRPSDVPTVGMP